METVLHRPEPRWRVARRRRIWMIRIVLLVLLALAVAHVMDAIRGDEGEIVVAFEGDLVEVADTPERAGALPSGVTGFDDHYPGVANLDPRLRDAVRAATALAEADGISMQVTSGWRSAGYQDRLFAQAVATYGPDDARRWVATAQTSAHVTGDAVDIGGWDAMDWLARNGAQFGLCQIYGNEAWHFELRPEAAGQGCPPQYPDPMHDPRMQS